MNVLNASTNMWITGVGQIPVGSHNLPLGGTIQVYTPWWGPSNAVVGSGDTLCLMDSGWNVVPGQGTAEAWVIGFTVALGALAVVGLGRYFARMLRRPDVSGDL